jgi:Histidine kinase-, DNA gyrase B-, and HSP90-like ATPase
VLEVDGGIAVYVTDDGRWMTREERRRLFHRFVTGRPLKDRTGLGLVITKDIVGGGEVSRALTTATPSYEVPTNPAAKISGHSVRLDQHMTVADTIAYGLRLKRLTRGEIAAEVHAGDHQHEPPRAERGTPA